MSGGSIERGKVSNVEIDSILSRMANPMCRRASRLEDVRISSQEFLPPSPCLVPTFYRSHWFLTAISHTQRLLCVFDSAPARFVHEKITAHFQRSFGGYKIIFAQAPKQARDSEDCGIFTILALVRVLLGMPHAPVSCQFVAHLRRHPPSSSREEIF